MRLAARRGPSGNRPRSPYSALPKTTPTPSRAAHFDCFSLFPIMLHPIQFMRRKQLVHTLMGKKLTVYAEPELKTKSGCALFYSDVPISLPFTAHQCNENELLFTL
jgi:hypothetical protein